jgi:hypothetical protein
MLIKFFLFCTKIRKTKTLEAKTNKNITLKLKNITTVPKIDLRDKINF